MKTRTHCGIMPRFLALMMMAVMLFSSLPVTASAYTPQPAAPDTGSGVFTAEDGTTYAVLYTGHIAVYVSRSDGGYAILPADEPFDGTGPLSYASFCIDGEVYRYGTYYAGVSGEVSIAPTVNEAGVLESHQSFGDFVISQYFAITRDTEHEDAYAIKVGYAAEYFGEDEARLGGRVLLDTQFTRDENVPVMLLDDADNAVLVETEALLVAAPVSASVSGEFMAEAGLPDTPNKGFLVFEDENWATPDSVVFAERNSMDGYSCQPDWDRPLFDGSGADSAVLLYWDDTAVTAGGTLRFGVNYGFTDMTRGKPALDSGAIPTAEPEAEAGLEAAAEQTAAEQTATVVVNHHDVPDEWFSVQASMPLTATPYPDGSPLSTLNGSLSADKPLTIRLAYTQNATPLIKAAVKQYRVWISWEGGADSWLFEETLDINSYVTLDDCFQYRNDLENLSVTLEPVVGATSEYTYFTVGFAGSSTGATAKLTGPGVQYFWSDNFSHHFYFLQRGSRVALTAEMAGLQYRPWVDDDGANYPTIRWGETLPENLPARESDLKGPLIYSYTFDVPAEGADTGEATMGILYNQYATSLRPINVKAFTTAYNSQRVEQSLWDAVGGDVVREEGILWGEPGGTVTVDRSLLQNYGNTYSLNVYKAGTQQPPAGVESPFANSFVMPTETVDLVFEGGGGRVFTHVTSDTGWGTATVLVSPEKPEGGGFVTIDVTNIEAGYSLKSISTDPAKDEIYWEKQPGGIYQFNMPHDQNAIITVELESDEAAAAAMHAVTVKPLAGDGTTLYDVFFWTDEGEGERLPYQVDEAGRLGKVREGTTVYYRLYPFTFDTERTEIGKWVIDSFTIDGKAVDMEGFTGPAYKDGSFTMPNRDVVMEVQGHKSDRPLGISVEAVTEDGKPLSLAGTSCFLFLNNVGSTVLQNEGFLGNDIRLQAPRKVEQYDLVSAWAVYRNFEPERLKHLENLATGPNLIYDLRWAASTDLTLRLVYTEADNRKLTVTGYEDNGDDWDDPGEVSVLMGGQARRQANVRAGDDGAYATEVTLRWSTHHGHDYELAGHTPIRQAAGEKTYRVELAADTTIPITQAIVAKPIRFYNGFGVDSPNTAKFSSVSLSALGDNGEHINLKQFLAQDPAPYLSKVTLLYPDNSVQMSTNRLTIENALRYPSKDFKNYPCVVGEIGTLDLVRLFNLGTSHVFAEGEYVLSLEWKYGAGFQQTGSKQYQFSLSDSAFRPGEVTHLAVVQKPDGSWATVPGSSYDQMNANAAGVGVKLLDFMNGTPNGFLKDDLTGVYQAQGTVVMNGHAYFKTMPSGSGNFYLEEKDGSVHITSTDMSFGTQNVPVWLPVQIGSAGHSVGSDTLDITLEKGKSYSIPADNYPKYSKEGYPNAEDAKEAYLAKVQGLRDGTVVIKPRSRGLSLSFQVGGYQMDGLAAEVNDIYLLGHGFDLGGRLLVQIPGASDPVFQVELVSLVTDNTAAYIPFDGVWAEGEGTVRLPDFLGGAGGSAAGVFNTFTQDFGFEADINLVAIQLSGMIYMARSERLGIPVLDRFEVGFDLSGMELGLGLPPAPVPIIEVSGLTMGVTNLADTVDYNPTRNTIPSVRFKLGGYFALVKVINFQAEMWAETLSGGIDGSADVGIGPFSLPIIKELSFALGVKDGPYDQELSKRSLLFFINASCKVSLFGIVEGAGGFDISMQLSPALWENGKMFESWQELVEFINLNLSASGYVYASANIPFTNISVSDADVRIDIVFAPGLDLKEAPLGFKKFEFIMKSRVLGVAVTEGRYDLIQMYPGLENWLKEQLSGGAESRVFAAASGVDTAQASMAAMERFLADPQASGLEPDSTYIGEHRVLGLGAPATDSEARTDAQMTTADEGSDGGSESASGIRVAANGAAYTHYVTVPDDGDYVLQLEGYGEAELEVGDLRVIKPNGQPLTIREMTGTLTTQQAETSYNAARLKGVLTLSLCDFMNATQTDINTSYATLPGEWQVTSAKHFKSTLIPAEPIPGVKSATISNGTLNMDFTVAPGEEYYYDVALERKTGPTTETLEGYPLVKNKPLSGSTASLDLTTAAYSLQNTLDSGTWYPRVTLRVLDEKLDQPGSSEPTLITSYVDSMLAADSHQVNNTTLTDGLVWAPELRAVPGGNQSIQVSFDAVQTPPGGMALKGYRLAVYDAATGAPAGKMAADTDGSQKIQPLKYELAAGAQANYDYALTDVPVGTYIVGVTPVFSAGDSLISREGAEVRSGSVAVSTANPPTLTLEVTGGNLVELNGSKIIYARKDARLDVIASDNATVTIAEYGATPIDLAAIPNLAEYSGKSLLITATNAQGDAATELVTVYACITPPLLLLDNYDAESGICRFTAYRDTGGYSITGTTYPGAVIGGATAGDDGRFSIRGSLPLGSTSTILTVSVSDAAGNVTMHEVEVVRGEETENPRSPKHSLNFVRDGELYTELVMEKGQEPVDLSPHLMLDNTAATGATWSSGAKSVASVSPAGIVTALKPGTTQITARLTAEGEALETLLTVRVLPEGAGLLTGAALNKNALSLNVGGKQTLKATVAPAKAPCRALEWRIEEQVPQAGIDGKAQVAMVDENGAVTALNPGTARVVVRAVGLNGEVQTDSCSLAVVQPPQSVAIAATDRTVRVALDGGPHTFTAKVLPETTTDTSLRWSTTAKAAAGTIDPDSGVFTVAAGAAPATFRVTAKTADGKKSSTVTVSLEQPVVKVASIPKTDIAGVLQKGKMVQMAVIFNDGAAPQPTDKKITWHSNDETVATVSTTGKVTALRAGTARIWAVPEYYTGAAVSACDITVEAPVTKAAIAQKGFAMTSSGTAKLSLALNDGAEYDTAKTTVSWSSSNDVLTFDDKNSFAPTVTASFTGGKPVTVKVTATVQTAGYGAKKATVSIKVLKPGDTVKALTSIAFKNSATAPTRDTPLAVGAAFTPSIRFTPSGAGNKNMAWTAAMANGGDWTPYITLNPATGKVTGLKATDTDITVTGTPVDESGGALPMNFTFTVRQLATALSFSERKITVNVGDVIELKPDFAPAEASHTLSVWSSNDKAGRKLKVLTPPGEDGKVLAEAVRLSALAAGTVKVTAAAGDGSKKKATITVVIRQPVTSLAISPPARNGVSVTAVEAGRTLALKPVFNEGGPKPSDTKVVWTSLHPAVASVNNRGVVTGLSDGVATIQLSAADGKTATFGVTVTVPAKKVELLQASFAMRPGDQVSINAATSPDQDLLSDDMSALAWTLSSRGSVPVEFVDANGNSLGERVETSDATIRVKAKTDVEGKATLKATTASGKSKTITITVKKNAVPLTGVTLQKSATWVEKGRSETLKAVLKTAGGAAGNRNLVWRIENAYDAEGSLVWDSAAIATVDKKGKVTVKNSGRVVVSVTTVDGEFVATCVVHCMARK
ncbi:Ig-like domain-containing protein [Ruminococcaceae bacterium OttesenSCG-928-D13]|nr:Ig-like domain-containing protein [Ruminococcaceae bacterium OttesenSCG-928-D13]